MPAVALAFGCLTSDNTHTTSNLRGGEHSTPAAGSPAEMEGNGKDAVGGRKAGNDALKPDSRFAALHTDPRFQRFPKQKQTVEIDKRFEGG